MKITHVIPALTKGGAERVVLELANFGAEAGDEVTILAAAPAPEELLAHRLRPEVRLMYVGHRSIARSYFRMIPWLLGHRQFLSEQDIIHCHLTFASVFGFLLFAMKTLWRSTRPAVVETYHGVGMAIPNWKRAFHRLLLANRDGVAMMAEDAHWRRFAQEKSHMLCRVIPNGIALPVAASAAAKDDCRMRTRLPSEPVLVVGTVGRLVPERRPELLLAAFSHVIRLMGPKVQVLFIGEGAERASLEQMIEQEGIGGQVHLPGLVLDPAEPISLMDLFITVNVGPITGIAGLEAAFLGVPVIACQLLSNHSLTANDWIWSSTDPLEVGGHAAELLANPAKLRELADRQQTHAQAHYSVAVMARAYDELYSAAMRRCGVATEDLSCP